MDVFVGGGENVHNVHLDVAPLRQVDAEVLSRWQDYLYVHIYMFFERHHPVPVCARPRNLWRG